MGSLADACLELPALLEWRELSPPCDVGAGAVYGPSVVPDGPGYCNPCNPPPAGCCIDVPNVEPGKYEDVVCGACPPLWYMKDAGDVWFDGFSDDAEMLGLALCDCGPCPCACIEGMLVRRSAEGVEAEGGKPYCCCC